MTMPFSSFMKQDLMMALYDVPVEQVTAEELQELKQLQEVANLDSQIVDVAVFKFLQTIYDKYKTPEIGHTLKLYKSFLKRQVNDGFNTDFEEKPEALAMQHVNDYTLPWLNPDANSFNENPRLINSDSVFGIVRFGTLRNAVKENQVAYIIGFPRILMPDSPSAEELTEKFFKERKELNHKIIKADFISFVFANGFDGIRYYISADFETPTGLAIIKSKALQVPIGYPSLISNAIKSGSLYEAISRNKITRDQARQIVTNAGLVIPEFLK